MTPIDDLALQWLDCTCNDIETRRAMKCAGAADDALSDFGIALATDGWRSLDKWACVDSDTYAFRVYSAERTVLVLVRYDYDGAPDAKGYRIKSVEVRL